MTRAMDTPFFEDPTGRRQSDQPDDTARSAEPPARRSISMRRSSTAPSCPSWPTTWGERRRPNRKDSPHPGHRGGFKVWKTSFWKRRRRLWAERNAAARAIAPKPKE